MMLFNIQSLLSLNHMQPIVSNILFKNNYPFFVSREIKTLKIVYILDAQLEVVDINPEVWEEM